MCMLIQNLSHGCINSIFACCPTLQMILSICSLETCQICVCQYKPQVKGLSFAYLRAVGLQMSLADTQPGNSKRDRTTTVKGFLQFLQTENANLEYVKSCLQRDESGQCFVSVMDKLYASCISRRQSWQVARETFLHAILPTN